MHPLVGTMTKVPGKHRRAEGTRRVKPTQIVRAHPTERSVLALHTLTRDYLTREAHHHFLIQAVVFCLLMMTMALPLLNGASAVVSLMAPAEQHF